MTKNEFYFSSANKHARMRAVEWLPEGEPKAVLHIFHGVEKVTRCQEELAEFFKEHGFVVVDSSCADSVTGIQVQEAMYTCFKNIKRKYPDVPYLLLGVSQGAVTVHSFVSSYPKAVEGIVLADAGQAPQTIEKDIPVLQVSGVEENRPEVLRYIYRWTEERLDEMLYQAATKQ